MKLSFRLRYLISGEIYCGSNLAVLVCRLLPLQMCLECGTLPSLATASGHTWQLQSDSLPHYCQCIHQSEVSREVTWPDILQSESLSTLLTVSGHFNISTTSHQQRKWDRIYRLVWNHVYYSLWSLSCMNMNTDWILFMRMSWHWGLVSDGYFAVLLDNWIIVVSELSWFLIILW